jgi:hypothetical protein
MRLLATILVAAGVLAAAVAAAARAEDPVPTRDCSTRGDPSDGAAVRFAHSGDVVVGPVSFAGLGLAASRTTRLDRGPDGRFMRKVAAKVLWGKPVAVSVSPASRAALALDYARSNQHTVAIRFAPCPPGTRMYGSDGRLRRVTVFPGGFSFLRRGCFELEVRVERGRTYRRTISLGAGEC